MMRKEKKQLWIAVSQGTFGNIPHDVKKRLNEKEENKRGQGRERIAFTSRNGKSFLFLMNYCDSINKM